MAIKGFTTGDPAIRRPLWRDVLGILVFIGLVALGTLFINTFLFRSFSVVGPSMENTLHTGDKLIVNRLTPSLERAFGGTYTPVRGQIIVFKNPLFEQLGGTEEYIVKRVIGLPGERVTVKDGVVTVYNKQYPNGFYPDKSFVKGDPNNGGSGPKSPTSTPSGDVDETVQSGSIFVMGDNRIGTNSLDSRSGLGEIPLYDVIGPVAMRFFPFTKISTF